jgi:hypothetical protein
LRHVNFVGWALEQDLGAFWGTGRCPRSRGPRPRHCSLHGCLYSSSNIFTMLHFTSSFFLFLFFFFYFAHVMKLVYRLSFLFAFSFSLLACIRIGPTKIYPRVRILYICIGEAIHHGQRKFYDCYIYIVKFEASGLEDMRFCQILRDFFFFLFYLVVLLQNSINITIIHVTPKGFSEMVWPPQFSARRCGFSFFFFNSVIMYIQFHSTLTTLTLN